MYLCRHLQFFVCHINTPIIYVCSQTKLIIHFHLFDFSVLRGIENLFVSFLRKKKQKKPLTFRTLGGVTRRKRASGELFEAEHPFIYAIVKRPLPIFIGAYRYPTEIDENVHDEL